MCCYQYGVGSSVNGIFRMKSTINKRTENEFDPHRTDIKDNNWESNMLDSIRRNNFIYNNFNQKIINFISDLFKPINLRN